MKVRNFATIIILAVFGCAGYGVGSLIEVMKITEEGLLLHEIRIVTLHWEIMAVMLVIASILTYIMFYRGGDDEDSLREDLLDDL